MNDSFNKPYDSKAVEEKIYKAWESSGYFNPDNLPTSKTSPLKPQTFSIIMPPPNANGSLHLGHALMIALEDIMIRYKRMKGFKTLWLPGADHAGFETQVVYQKKLEKEGKNWFQIPREQLWQEIWDFTQANKNHMENQVKRLGASCDWSREKFTLDKDIVEKVQNTFIELYNEKLVYRGERLVHWCPKHQTGFSDLEINYEERKNPLYYIKYGPLTVATVRPETIFGDVAVAVNPKDKRYKDLIGKEIEVDVVVGKLKLKVIADDTVDMKFGTGAVKITPAHDNADFEMWQRHKDPLSKKGEGGFLSEVTPKEVINKFGKMDLVRHFPNSELAKKYEGIRAVEARKMIVEELQNKGLIEKADENYKSNISLCYKCGSIIEPRLMKQWFIKMGPLAKPAIEAVKKGQIKFVPDRYKKVYFHWLKNIRDWNISRQIVWGIQIPAYQCVDCKEWIILKEKPAKCPKCSSAKVEQDPDVFDTWFSSGQWPFLTLGYSGSSKSKIKNQKSKISDSDYEQFYPTDVMETGWDILFFWVARMVMMGIYKTKKIPFKYIYLHGLVRDKHGLKMSKSKGNVVDPITMVDLYGSDALRMGLIVGNTPGTDLNFSEEKIRGYRNFANKIWQASRFVLINTEDAPFLKGGLGDFKLTPSDKKHLKEFEALKKKITKQMDTFKFHLAAEELYHYFWHTFADKIIEESKDALKGGEGDFSSSPKKSKGDLSSAIRRQSAQYTLLHILTGSLRMLHPFMPFITEEIYSALRSHNGEGSNFAQLLMIDKWD